MGVAAVNRKAAGAAEYRPEQPAVRMLEEYGVARFKQKLQSLGLTTLYRPASEYGLTLILGGAEVRGGCREAQ